MPQIFAMCGLPFSGKSTISTAIAEYLSIPRISFDEIWVEVEKDRGIVPGDNPIEQWQYIKETCEERLVAELQKGNSVVYDNLGDKIEHRDHIRNLARENKSEAITIYVQVSKEVVLKRREKNKETGLRHQVTDENFYRALDSFEPPITEKSVVIIGPEMEIEQWVEKELTKTSRR